MDAHSEDSSDFSQLPDSYSDQRVYFVPYRWWKDSLSTDSDVKRGISYSASSVSSYGGPMKIISNIFSSDLVFNLRREEGSVETNENGKLVVSRKDYALVSGEMWLQALKWHSDSKVATKDSMSFSAAEDDMGDVYPLQLRLSVLRETNSLGVKISKKLSYSEEPARSSMFSLSCYTSGTFRARQPYFS